MNGLGITRRRIDTIRLLGRATLDGSLSLGTSPSLEEAVESLVALPGVGPWIAQYIAMRALGEPDAFPSGDLGLRKACATAKSGKISERKLLERAEAWRPWRAYAALHLWSSLSD